MLKILGIGLVVAIAIAVSLGQSDSVVPGDTVKWAQDTKHREWKVIKIFPKHERPFADIRCREVEETFPPDVRVYAELADLSR